MCGIAGFLTPRGNPSEAAALRDRMVAAIEHRGPDAVGVWDDSAAGIWLGMRRLSIIALADGQQPIWNETKTLGVFFNGEIYNHVELRRDLEARGHIFATHSDTEVLVHGLEEEGLRFLERVRGMFAVCWIDRTRRKITLARDHFGQKPLYWYWRDGVFAFASEIKALRCLPSFPADVNPDALLDYLGWFCLPAPETHYRHVHKLPPASSLEIAWDQAAPPTARPYWSTPVDPTPFPGGMRDAEEELERLLQDSMRLHSRADVPLGLLLSGGLDSKTIAHFASTHLGRAPLTYTAIFDGVGSEAAGARQTAREVGSDHTEVEVTARDLSGQIDWVARHLDEPMGDPAALALGMICRRARRDVKVVLSGEGSDEMLAGYVGRYLGRVRTSQKSEKLRQWLGFLGQKPGTTWPESDLSRLRWRLGAGVAGELPTTNDDTWPGTPRRGFTRTQAARHLARAHEIGQRLIPSEGSLLQRCLAMDQRWQLPEYLLQKADKMSMAASLELRSPFLDVPLANFAASLPDGFRLGQPDGPGKLVLRRLMNRKFGAQTMELPKQGFTMPFASWMRGPLKAELETAVLDPAAAWRETLDAELVQSAWRDFVAGHHPHYQVFYALWLYEVWRHTCLDAPSRSY